MNIWAFSFTNRWSFLLMKIRPLSTFNQKSKWFFTLLFCRIVPKYSQLNCCLMMVSWAALCGSILLIYLVTSGSIQLPRQYQPSLTVTQTVLMIFWNILVCQLCIIISMITPGLLSALLVRIWVNFLNLKMQWQICKFFFFFVNKWNLWYYILEFTSLDFFI